jgi:anti-sigma28 factor (negative regulator of flagellin synthesis)
MKIVESEALKTQKPQTDKVYEPSKASRRDALTGTPSAAGETVTGDPAEDGVALSSHDQLHALAMAAGAGENSRIAQLTQLVQSGQYQVDPTALSGAIVGSMLKGY